MNALALCTAAVLVAGLQEPLAELELELVGGRIYVPAEVDEHATSVILDTGASSSVMDLARVAEWGLPTHGEVKVAGVGSQDVKGKLLGAAEVTFGGLSERVGFAIPLDVLAGEEGRRLEVVLGHPFFAAHVVEVDYATRRLRVFDAEADLSAGRTAVPIRLVDGQPHVRAVLVLASGERELETLVDSGASRSSLTARFTRAHALDVPMTERMVLGGGVSGAVEGRLLRPEAVKLGTFTCARPILSWVETAGGATGANADQDAVIGADLLARFRVTFDYPHARILLEPGADLARPFEADKTGLRLRAVGPDLRTCVVAGVLAGSSAEAAGLRVDDVIESVDGASAARFTLQELREHFRSAAATGWQLGVRRGAETLAFTLVAKSIV